MCLLNMILSVYKTNLSNMARIVNKRVLNRSCLQKERKKSTMGARCPLPLPQESDYRTLQGYQSFPMGIGEDRGGNQFIPKPPPPLQSPWEMGVSKLALREASHDLRAPGSEPSWVASQLEALPAKLLLSSQLPHINKWTTMQMQVLLPTGQIIF